MAVGLTAGLGLDGDRCIRMIPQQKLEEIGRKIDKGRIASSGNSSYKEEEKMERLRDHRS